MFSKNRRKNLFGARKYKIDRGVRFKNPIRLQKGIFKFKLFKLINLILIVGIFACLYFFIFSDFYEVDNIEILGNEIISTEDILDIADKYLAQKKLFVFKNRNIFLFSKNKFKEKISEVILLDDIVVNKVLPNSIKITLQEKESALKWASGGNDYLVDVQGIVIKRYFKLVTPKIFQIIEADSSANNNNQESQFLVVNNLADQPTNLGDRVLNQEDVNFIINLLTELRKIDYFELQEISASNNLPQYIIIKSSGGWQIYFNLANPIESQLSRLDILIKEKIGKQNLSQVDYIDLRLGESIYYKFK